MNVSEIAEVYIDDIEIPDAPAAGPSNDVKPAQEKKEKLDEIIEVLPGMKSPTITPLANDEWVSVQSVIAEKHFWEIIGKLKSLGAEGILVLPIEKMIV